ncbi:iron homeostasis regulator [Bacillus sp. SKDU12]|nr:iron homeostasis regulator [Bacillus sp. SKDU12]
MVKQMTMLFLFGAVCTYSVLIGFVLKGISNKSVS